MALRYRRGHRPAAPWRSPLLCARSSNLALGGTRPGAWSQIDTTARRVLDGRRSRRRSRSAASPITRTSISLSGRRAPDAHEPYMTAAETSGRSKIVWQFALHARHAAKEIGERRVRGSSVAAVKRYGRAVSSRRITPAACALVSARSTDDCELPPPPQAHAVSTRVLVARGPRRAPGAEERDVVTCARVRLRDRRPARGPSMPRRDRDDHPHFAGVEDEPVRAFTDAFGELADGEGGASFFAERSPFVDLAGGPFAAAPAAPDRRPRAPRGRLEDRRARSRERDRARGGEAAGAAGSASGMQSATAANVGIANLALRRARRLPADPTRRRLTPRADGSGRRT